MNLMEIFLLAFALSIDAFSVAAAVGLTHRSFIQVLRMPFHFGLFQALMSGAGAVAGQLIMDYIARWDHWLVWGLLLLIGLKMIYESFGEKRFDESDPKDLTKGWILIGLSFAVSLDALAAGVGLAVSNAPIIISVSLIGVISWIVPTLGMLMARLVDKWIGRKCEVVAGIVLIFLGFKTLFDHFQ
ncbi:MAG: manganese efflux pump [Oligoflexales bacterium]|nr:manganese efflux pump [Oligoflexales bacterium]